MQDELVTLETFLMAHEAELALGFLEANGIDAFLADENMSRLYVAPLVGGIRLQVRAEDAERARELLQEVRDEPGAE
jgi:hypothetical protein